MDLEQLLATLLHWLATEGVKILFAFVVLVISFFIIKRVARRLYLSMEKKKVDKTVSKVV